MNAFNTSQVWAGCMTSTRITAHAALGNRAEIEFAVLH